MFVVGLTGGIASGKTTVSAQLRRLGCPVIDADLIAHQVVEPGKPAWKKIRDKFGPEFFHDDGTLDREKLGQVIFTDPSKRCLLNSITHPQIQRTILLQTLLCLVKGEQFVVLDIPLLLESGAMLPFMTHVVVVYCDRESQLTRLCARNQFTRQEAEDRVIAQMALDEKRSRATTVIDNCGSMDETAQQVERLFHRLRASRQHWKLRLALLAVLVAVAGVVHWKTAHL